MSAVNMGRPMVSVLMAVRNAAPYLREAIDSFLAQTYTEAELICVDDCSDDTSLRILQEYATQNEGRVVVVGLPKHEGLAVCRNVALGKARGELLCILDADDWFSPDTLELTVEGLTRCPEADCALMSLLMERPEGSVPYPSPLAVGESISGREAMWLALGWKLHGLYVARRSLFERYPYDTSCRLFSDDNTPRLHYLRSRRVVQTAGEYHYRQHTGSATHKFSVERFLLMKANLALTESLEREGVDREMLQYWEHLRWLNYKGQMRLYHQRHRLLTAEEQRGVRRALRDIYRSFCVRGGWRRRLIPFPLFEARQWLGWKKQTLWQATGQGKTTKARS